MTNIAIFCWPNNSNFRWVRKVNLCGRSDKGFNVCNRNIWKKHLFYHKMIFQLKLYCQLTTVLSWVIVENPRSFHYVTFPAIQWREVKNEVKQMKEQPVLIQIWYLFVAVAHFTHRERYMFTTLLVIVFIQNTNCQTTVLHVNLCGKGNYLSLLC